MFCPKCGTQNVDNAQFCMKCGAQLGMGAAPNIGGAPNMGYSPAPATGTGTGLQPNVAALLAYLFGWISGLIFYFVEKDKFVRFHALQSIMLSGVFFVLLLITWIIPVRSFTALTVIGTIGTILWIAMYALLIICMIQAYQKVWFKLPFVGDIAQKHS